MFSFEKLDVFVVAIEFRGMVEGLVPKRGQRDLKDQIERAATSICLNIAEGANRRGSREKAHFYDIARGSAGECAAALAILKMTSELSEERYASAREALRRIVMMLNRLIAHFSDNGAPPVRSPRL